MKTCSKEDAIVLDKKQLAYKVSANSQYGAMGVRRGYLPFMPGAMCITYLGRESIKKAANIVCEKYNAKWIYTDTDSTYIIFPHLTTPTEIWDEAIRVAGLVSNEFPGSISLEFEEAIYKKFIILSKKRYVYTSIDRNGTCNGNIGKKGVVLVRRDNACITRRIYENIVRMVFDNATKEMIIDYIIESINDLFRNIVPFTDFVITKSVGCTENDNDTDEFMGDYKIKPLPKDPNERLKALNGMTEKEYAISKCPPQVRLAELIKSRGRPVDDGSRLEFVIVDRNTKAVKVGDKMEDFEYFIKRSRYLSIDKLYYLDALINPIDQLLPIVIGSVDFMKCQYKIRENHYKMVKQLKKMFSPRVIMQS
jgi:DNA polymerase elongation subunit (family B)